MSGPASPEGRLGRYAAEQGYCNLCPRLCRHACPVSNAERDEAVTPQAKNTAALLARTGARELQPELAELFYACTACRQCRPFCEHGNDVAPSLLAARAFAVDKGVVLPAVEQVRQRFLASGNAYGEDLVSRLAHLPPDRRVGEHGPVSVDRRRGVVPLVPTRGLRVYFAGCDTLHHRPDLIDRLIAVADRLGEVDLAVYCGEAQCSGYALLAAGLQDLFVQQARKVAEALEGARRVYTSSPEVAWTFLHAYPEIAGVSLSAEVHHVVDLLLPALRHAPVAPPVELDAAWHDPCYLGRFLGRYDEPRTLMNRLLRRPMQEPGAWTRETSYCCGGGGLLPQTFPEAADAITRTRVADLTGSADGPPAEAAPGRRDIVTACPTCTGRFREAGARTHDVVDVLAAYLGLAEL